MRWFEPVAFLGIRLVDGENGLSTAPFGRARLVPLIGKKVFQARKQERPELALGRTKFSEMILRQKFGKKLLRQVLRIFGTEPLPPHISVERIPIAAAQIRERPLGTGRVTTRCELDHAP